MQPSFLETTHHRLAYLKQNGDGPTVMFCSGFKSDMTGTKAAALAAYCEARGQSFIRFDYSGHGQSSGKFEDGTIGQWKRDTLAVLDVCTQGEVILVGSSMGGWLSLLAALERPERVKALVGVACAPDFTERLIWEKLSSQQQEGLLRDGVFYAPSCYGEAPYPITRLLIEEAHNHLLLDKELPIKSPIHLLHGTKDEDVPVEIAKILVNKLPQSTLTLIEGGNHRLSEPSDLRLLCEAVAAFSV